MPVVASTAYQNAGLAFSIARSCLNDSAANVFSDAVLLPYSNISYRQVQRALSVNGGPLFISDNLQFTLAQVVTIDPSLQTSLTDVGYNNGTVVSNPPQLPTDLLEPEKIWERPTGSNSDFIEMTDLTEGGGLTSLPQGATLGVWEWRSDGIYFRGATQSTDIRLRYKKAYPDLTQASDPILIRNSADCIGFNTAALAAMARGSPLSDKWSQAGEQALEALVQASTRREQQRVRRRQSFSSRSGGYSGGQGWSWSRFS